MKRTSLTGALVLSAVAVVASAGGCTAIVGVGSYAVGTASDGSTEDGTSSGASSGGSSSGSSGGTSSGTQEAGRDTGPQEGGTDAPVHVDAMGYIGDPCTRNADCTKGTCNGEWCSLPCTTSFSCGTNSTGGQNYCVGNPSGVGSSCAPGCALSSDCLAYTGTVCSPISSTERACTKPSTAEGGGPDGSPGPGMTGDPCKKNSDCMNNNCGNATWCEANCASTSDTSCGSNTVGITNVCAYTGSGTTNYACFPGCTKNVDCSSFAGTTCQTTTTSGPPLVCAFTNGSNGDPCSNSSTSAWVACTSPTSCNGAWCNSSCTSDTSCGTNTAGVQNRCINNTGGTMSCFPGCTSTDDCAVYSDSTTGKPTYCQTFSGKNVCSTSAGKIGDPCTTSIDCNFTCPSGGGICTTTCTSDSQCSTNSSGRANYCDTTSGQCFPSCTSNADCVPFGSTATCQTFSGITGSVCSY